MGHLTVQWRMSELKGWGQGWSVGRGLCTGHLTGQWRMSKWKGWGQGGFVGRGLYTGHLLYLYNDIQVERERSFRLICREGLMHRTPTVKDVRVKRGRGKEDLSGLYTVIHTHIHVKLSKKSWGMQQQHKMKRWLTCEDMWGPVCHGTQSRWRCSPPILREASRSQMNHRCRPCEQGCSNLMTERWSRQVERRSSYWWMKTPFSFSLSHLHSINTPLFLPFLF